jgi:hypothetical protein
MGFMQRQVTVKRKWYEIETHAGTFFVDVDDVDGGKFAESLAGGLELDTFALKQLEKDYRQYTEGSRLEGVSVREGYPSVCSRLFGLYRMVSFRHRAKGERLP